MLTLRPYYLVLLACIGLLVPYTAIAFDFSNVNNIAKKLAEKPYQAPPTVPSNLLNLEYDQYRQIRFKPEKSLWHESNTNFQVMLVAPGLYFQHPVKMHIIDATGVHPLGFHKNWFNWPEGLKDKVPDDLGYAGLKLTFPLNAPNAKNQFLVFAGASYFRGVARDQWFGLSARGIAVNTGLPGGEEFPRFSQFWLVRPSPDANTMTIYALLEGKSLTGAYRFTIHPGSTTSVDVKAQLHVRAPIKLLGLAPLTSMFYYGENTPRPDGAWRPAVHDSGGLLIHDGTGEWLWRPLINPINLKMDYFSVASPRGFGLLQRNTHFSHYQDAQAHYNERPSSWVTPQGDWGKGHVVLVQIPTNAETNDNIVAFWTPKGTAEKGDNYSINYRLSFGPPDMMQEPMAHVANTLVGRENNTQEKASDKTFRIMVDFTGGRLDTLSPDEPVTGVVTGLDGTKVLHNTITYIKSADLWRLALLVKPPEKAPMRLRAYLKQGDDTLSETWTYSLPVQNRFTQ